MDEENSTSVDYTKYKYVIYARKSSEDSEKQLRSIPDQIEDCKKLARDQNLNVVLPPIQETKSAKKPHQRPEFKKIMKMVQNGEIDGVIAWHPDRLARNMIDAGKIIYQLDTGTLKDLRFHSHQFSNDANGKMLLGMLFVFAKHYSDDLSSKVSRGTKKNLRDGKSGGTPKHGYIRDDEGIYRADKDAGNFQLMQEAWHKKADVISNDQIAEYLNQSGYQKYVKREGGHTDTLMTKQILSKVFNDTFYFGVLNQAGQSVDLRQLPYPFEPMTDEDTFYKAQQYNRLATRGRGKKKMTFLPLRGIVFCSSCNFNKSVIVAKSKSRLSKYYVYLYCRNTECNKKPKNVRARSVILDLITIVEEKLKNLPERAYDKYREDIADFTETQKERLVADISRNRTVIKGHTKKRADLSLSMAKIKDTRAVDDVNLQIAELSTQIDKLEEQIELNKRLIQKSEVPVLTREEFKVAIENTYNKLKNGSWVQKDAVIRTLFLNLHIDNKKVTSYLWREPFSSLVEATDVLYGRGERTQTFDLTVPNRARYQLRHTPNIYIVKV